MGSRYLKRVAVIAITLSILFHTALSVYAVTLNIGATKAEFQLAVQFKKITLKRVRVGKTILIYDTALPRKRIKQIKKWIKQLPPKVQKSAKKVYFLRKKYFKLTMRSDLPKTTAGYAILGGYNEIYLYNRSDTYDVRRILWHEFGHTYDSRKKTYGSSKSKKWIRIAKTEYPDYDKAEEVFADVFAEYFEFLYEPENKFITKLLKAK